MGLSLRSIGKKIGDIAGGVERQVNPLDHGATYANPHPTPAPAPPRPAPTPIRSGGPAPVSTFLANNPNAVGGGMSPYQTGGFVTNIVRPALRTVPEVTQTLLHPGDSSYHPGSGIEKALFGQTPVQNIQAKVHDTQKKHGNLAAIGEGALSVANDLPTLGAAAKVARPVVKVAAKEVPRVAQAVKIAADARAPLVPNEVGSLNPGKPKASLKLPTKVDPNAEQNVFSQNPMNPPIPKTTGNERFPSAPNSQVKTIDQVIANSTDEAPTKVAGQRIQQARNADAERAALDHLSKGGSRDEAIALYQQTARSTQKQASYRVSQAAKEAKQGLNVTKHSDNPLAGKFYLPEAKPGEYLIAPKNQATVTTNIDRATKNAEKAFQPLTPKDRANIPHFVEGTADISKADHPANAQAAVDASKALTDTVHALDAPAGQTAHVSNYFPRYYADAVDQSGKAQMALEEAALAGKPIPLEDPGNYGGFHNKQRVFANRKEAEAAGFTNLHTDPLQDLQRYASGAKLNVGNQAFIKAVREAQGAKDPSIPFKPGQTHSIDLPGTDSVKVDKVGAKALKNYGVQKPGSPLKKVLRSANTTVVKTIVANPVFHGGNQEFNALFAGAWRMPGNKVANVFKLLQHQLVKNGGKITDVDRQNFYREGNFSPDYGKNRYGFIAKGLEKAGLNPAMAELSPRGMAAIEENIRVSLWKLGKERGMSPAQNTAVINKVLGAPDILSDMSSSVGLFIHYFTTNLKLLGDTGVRAAKGDVAPLIGLAVGTGAWVAATKGWQAATGNPDATVRAPGALGVASQVVKGVNQLRHGQVPGALVNHTNPLVTTAIEQLTNRDLHKPVVGPSSATNSLTGPSGSGRIKVTESNLFGPGQTVQKTMGGSTSPAEAAVGYATGLYTPHAKGYQAAPNIAVLNKSNAKPGTGMAQQKQFFKAQDKAQNLVYGDNRAQAAYDNYLKRDKNPQGKTVLLSPEEALSAAAGLAANPKALQAVQILKRDGNSQHDPMWDLPTKDLKAFLDYESTRKTDPELGVKRDLVTFSNGQKLTDFIKQRSQYYGDAQGVGSGSVPAPGTPKYPTISSQTQNLLDQYSAMTDPAAKSQFIRQHPEVGQAFSDLFEYNNKLGVAQGGQALKAHESMAPAVQNAYNQYLALPQHDGPKGGSKTRALWIQAHPKEWAQITASLASNALYQVDKEGAKNMYQGEKPSQALLKNIYNLGQYDIQKSSNGGNTTYNIGSSSGSSSGSGSGSKSGKSGKSTPRTSKEVKTFLSHNSYKFGTDRLKVKTKKTSIAKATPKVKTFNIGRKKATLARAKVANKPRVTIKKGFV